MPCAHLHYASRLNSGVRPLPPKENEVSEHYVRVKFSLPQDRQEELMGALERARGRMTTPEEALDAYSPFGSDAINLLKTARANGKPAWVAPEMSLADQLQLCALSVKGKSVTATYMCGDSGTQQRLSNFMAKLYRVAGMEDVFVKGANEHDA